MLTHDDAVDEIITVSNTEVIVVFAPAFNNVVPENLLLLQGEKELLVDCNRQLLSYYSKVRLEVHESQSFGI